MHKICLNVHASVRVRTYRPDLQNYRCMQGGHGELGPRLVILSLFCAVELHMLGQVQLANNTVIFVFFLRLVLFFLSCSLFFLVLLWVFPFFCSDHWGFLGNISGAIIITSMRLSRNPQRTNLGWFSLPPPPSPPVTKPLEYKRKNVKR